MSPEQKMARYEELKTLEREIKKEIESLAPEILPLIPEDKEVQGEKGYFYIQKKSKWSYSQAVKTDEEALKKKKAQEEADGTAKVSYTPILYYRSGTPEEQQ